METDQTPHSFNRKHHESRIVIFANECVRTTRQNTRFTVQVTNIKINPENIKHGEEKKKVTIKKI